MIRSILRLGASKGWQIQQMDVKNAFLQGELGERIEEVKNMLQEKFKMKNLGELHSFQGTEIIRSLEGVWLSQYQYVMKLLKNFGMVDCKGISTPLEQNTKIQAYLGSNLEDSTMYMIVGGLIYLMMITCPNLSYVVGLVS